MNQPTATARRIPPTLLVVEDESVVAMDLDGQLHDMGYHVCGCVDNGRDAIERARAEHPDLILMDIVLKGNVDGITAATEIGRELHIPVLFLSAYSDDQTVARAADAWPYGYLTKPFEPRELRAGIEVALRKADVERSLRESERWLAAVVRGVGDAVIATDAGGRIDLANPAAERLLGLDALPGRIAAEVVQLRDPDGGGALPLAPDAVLAAGGAVPAQRAALLVGQQGTLIPVDCTVGAIGDANGRQTGLAIVLHDMRERVAVQERLARSEHRFRNAFDNAPLGLALIDRDNRFVRVNRALCRLLDAEPAQLMSANQAAFGDAADNAIEQAALRDLAQGRCEAVQYERRYRGTAGREVWALVSASLMPANADPPQFLVQIDDVTQRKRAEEALAHLAHHDALTGVANRTLLNEEAEHELAVARRQGGRLAVVFIDLDFFKHVNDSLGHEAGDTVLKEMATRLSGTVRAMDLVGRMGGDEFVVVLCGVTDAHDVLVLTDKLRTECGKPVQVDAHEVRLAVSMGVSLFPDDAGDFRTLLRFADSALYQAKGEGRNNVQFYRPELTVRMEQRTRLGAGLRVALERNELELHYQPIVAVGDGRPAAAEALIRWRHPELGLLLPDVFLPMLEESSMGEAIGAWTLHEACRQAALWNAPGMPPLRMSVNVTAAQFRSDTLVRTVDEALRASGLPSARLCIEITEQHQLADDDHTRRVLAGLKDLGVLVAIDDFGTGYSSLSYISRLQPDEIKIDKSLVTDVDRDPQRAGLVTAALAMARSLDLEVVSEGVETAAELEFLRARGCDMVQGFLYARPGLPADVERWLAQGAPPGGMGAGA